MMAKPITNLSSDDALWCAVSSINANTGMYSVTRSSDDDEQPACNQQYRVTGRILSTMGARMMLGCMLFFVGIRLASTCIQQVDI